MIGVYAFNGRTDKKGTHYVKIFTEKITVIGRLASEQAGKRTSG